LLRIANPHGFVRIGRIAAALGFKAVSSDLWAAVVMQAKEDVEDLPVGSVDYQAAVAFLTSPSAYWQQARADIAAHLMIHGDDIRHAGQRWVITRRRAEGLPDFEPQRPAAPRTLDERLPSARAPLVVPAMLRAALGCHARTGPSRHKVRA
jgi:hypothetical protein